MSTHNPKYHRIEHDIVVLQSKHLGDVVEIYIDKEKRRFYGVTVDGNIVEHYPKAFSDFACVVMLYKIHYSFRDDTWVVGYTLQITNKAVWKDGFATAREAWLYREALIASGVAKR